MMTLIYQVFNPLTEVCEFETTAPPGLCQVSLNTHLNTYSAWDSLNFGRCFLRKIFCYKANRFLSVAFK